MRIFKLLIGMLLLVAEPLSAQSEWNITTEKYSGNEYIIKKSQYIHAITNKKYNWVKESTQDIEFNGETEKEFNARRQPLYQKIYDVANGVFNFSNIPVSRDEQNEFILVCYFDPTSKNYMGCRFIFDAEVKDYFTLKKLNLLENNLLKANLNAGKANLLKPNKKYFVVKIGIRIGK